MSTNEARSQDSAAITIAGDDTKVIDDIPDWEEPSTEYGRHGEPTGHDYVRYPACGTKVLDGETPTVSHRSVCHYK